MAQFVYISNKINSSEAIFCSFSEQHLKLVLNAAESFFLILANHICDRLTHSSQSVRRQAASSFFEPISVFCMCRENAGLESRVSCLTVQKNFNCLYFSAFYVIIGYVN